MRRWSWAWSIFAVLVGVGVSTSARADRAIVVVGAATPDALAVPSGAGEAARAATRAAQWSVEPALLPPQERQVLDCLADSRTAGSCIKRALDGVDVDRVIVVAVSGGRQGQAWELLGTVFRTTGDELATAQRFCEGCDATQLADDARAITTELVRSAQAMVSPSRLVVTSSPSNAEVLLDNEPVGATPLDYKPFAGPHTIEVRKTGHRPEIRQVVIGAGERTVLELELTPTDGGPKGGGQGPRILPWVVVGVGAAAVVGGVALFAVDEDINPDPRREPRYRDTAPLGIGALAGGAVVVGVGVWMLLKNDDKRTATTTPAVVPTAMWDGATALVGASGRF